MSAVAVLSGVLAVTPPAWGQGGVSREHAIKAAYLYNFARYVTWPEGTFRGDTAPLVIGVIGLDPVTGYLDEIARKGKKIGGRRIVVRRCRTWKDCTACHMVFVGKSNTDQQRREIIRKLDKQSLLLVGQTPGFARDAGIINFYVAANKVRFEINPDVAKQRSLKISSKLLALARIVRTSTKER